MRFTRFQTRKISRLSGDQTGATAIEYALIASLISIAAIVAMQSLGNQLSDTFSSTNQIMENR